MFLFCIKTLFLHRKVYKESNSTSALRKLSLSECCAFSNCGGVLRAKRRSRLLTFLRRLADTTISGKESGTQTLRIGKDCQATAVGEAQV